MKFLSSISDASKLTETLDKQFISKADKDKLDSVQTGANNYSHPATHPASIITQDENNRFVTDAEKSKLANTGTTYTGEEITATAKDQIKIGDVVYVIKENLIYNSNIYANVGTTALSSNVTSASFSPDGNLLVLGGNFTGYAKIYSVSGTTVTYVSDIYADTGTTALNKVVRSVAFSPDGTKLVLGGEFSGRAKVYSVSGVTITYMSELYSNIANEPFYNEPNLFFSPDSSKLIATGSFTNRAKIYSVSDNAITFIGNIYADSGSTILDNYGSVVAFSPDGTKLILGGGFTGKAKIYSVSGTTVTFVSNIYADTGTTALNDTVLSASFSPDGTKLILGGWFTGYAKIYSVSGTTVTYISNIYADAGTTALSDRTTSSKFSPDGNKLVLGGNFTGYAKIYSISGTTITFISNIYADTGTTALSSSVNSMAFSPDGTKLVLGGWFSGYSKIYLIPVKAYKLNYESTPIPSDTILGASKSDADIDSNATISIFNESEKNLHTKVNNKASFKSGTGTFSSGNLTHTVTDAFITSNTMVTVSPTSTKVGIWSVNSTNGSFTITSDTAETTGVTFDWGAVK